MRIWDVKSSENVSFFVANSKYVSDRIKKIYNRDSTIIYPPVNIDKFTIQENKEDFYIAASRLVSYKKIALIVKAFNKLPDKKLKVIGSGPQRKYIEKIANKNIEILGYVEDTEIVKKIQSAKALVFAADEDFGILPVEAQACGTPVIAFNKGGVKETVLENKTGLFFDTQTTEDIIKAVEKFENLKFNPIEIRKNAERFSRVRFENEFRAFVELKTKEFYN
jgi:glycosyltransferase involved in cell wall biosynthesis